MFPANIQLCKVCTKSTRRKCDACSKLTTKTSEQCHVSVVTLSMCLFPGSLPQYSKVTSDV